MGLKAHDGFRQFPFIWKTSFLISFTHFFKQKDLNQTVVQSTIFSILCSINNEIISMFIFLMVYFLYFLFFLFHCLVVFISLVEHTLTHICYHKQLVNNVFACLCMSICLRKSSHEPLDFRHSRWLPPTDLENTQMSIALSFSKLLVYSLVQQQRSTDTHPTF